MTIRISLYLPLTAAWFAWSMAATAPAAAQSPAERHVYPTGGVHNTKGCTPPSNCIAPRKPGEPADPLYPATWSSEWIMYRVFRNADRFPPPYASPPDGLTPSDYEVSHGATYYDANYRPRDGDGSGAMMEYYRKRCLPIFPMKNDFSCAFISLGNKAYFLRYADRPAGTPACCQFSLENHPPRRDFIKHLPYDAARSAHLGGSLQAYATGGAGPLFGYAFEKRARRDSYNKAAPAYRHPQSFYFSGFPGDPPNAPIVSQNYRNFRMQPPDPRTTWDQVARTCRPQPQWCCLFDGDCEGGESKAATSHQQWNGVQSGAGDKVPH
ncbi:hypothetical protein INH39_30125 [Massilia violaceinigra]|uniref:Uncharacterized protein n=1 Tax=Massilia violaceinigra TaxID=2045208 RepID=A0ABY4A488_9BURK|nr:hypothetical protein [Massilia violaceinigra]UOD29598.1 hypothetical protein INH39_30125 [Massilia violaceinigra]